MKSINDILPPLQEIISIASGVPKNRVILGNQGHGAPAGNDPYISYLPTPLRVYGRPQSSALKDVDPIEAYDKSLDSLIDGGWKDFNQTLSTNWVIMVSITVFNEGADTIAMKLPFATSRNDILALAKKSNISIRQASNIRNLSGLMQAGVQPRYNLDVEFWAKLDIDIDILRAARVPFIIREADSNKVIAEG